MKFKTLIVLALSIPAIGTAYAQSESLFDGRSGRIEFQSINVPDMWQFARKNTSNTRAQTVWGDLLLPKTISGKAPALAIHRT